MAFRIPPRAQAEWVPGIHAAAAVFELVPELDPKSIVDAIENAVQSGTLECKDLDRSRLVPGSGVMFDWDSGRVCLAFPNVSPLLWHWMPFVLRQDDVFALFTEPESTDKPAKRATGKRPTVKEAIQARILAALVAGRDIGDRDHDAITAEFGDGASRGTCVAALREALSAFQRR